MKVFFVELTGREAELPCGCGQDDCKVIRKVSEWRRTDTGETLFGWPEAFGVGVMHFDHEHAPGMCYANWDNCEGRHLIVHTPGGSWDIDSRAANCDKRDERTHRCWVRHGEPPSIHVDKNGNTCGAGAGSIQCGSYHGFLHNGELT